MQKYIVDMKKPVWLNKKINISTCRKVKSLIKELNLNTVCQEALCPNISECFKNRTATFMILGSACTRGCAFCGVAKRKPLAVDFDEPKRVREAVKRLGLNYIVITSPTRDDLEDGGVSLFCRAVQEVKSLGPEKKVEILIPDFMGKEHLMEQAAACGADVIAHNLETVPSLYSRVRNGADYSRSLKVLEFIKFKNKKVFTKSGLMLGLGESFDEVIKVLKDLRQVSCDFLTLGQYLPPSSGSFALKEYIAPDKFDYFRDRALELGFKKVKSSSYTRSSYLAHSFF